MSGRTSSSGVERQWRNRISYARTPISPPPPLEVERDRIELFGRPRDAVGDGDGALEHHQDLAALAAHRRSLQSVKLDAMVRQLDV